MYTSRISVSSGHAHDQFTDHLYDPLRKTFQQDTTTKRSIMSEAAQISQISRQASPRNIFQNRQLVKDIPMHLERRHSDS